MDQGAIRTSMGFREWGMLLSLSLLWGGSFFFVGVAVGELPPLTIVALRVGLAAPLLWAVAGFLGHSVPRERRVWGAFLAMGLINNAVPFTLIVWGQTQIASGLASILNATTPLFTVVVAGLVLSDENITRGKLTGVVAGFAGTAIMIGPDALRGLGANLLAQVAILGAALSYAFAAVFGRRFRVMGVAPVVTAAGQVTASSAIMIPVALLVEKPWVVPAPNAQTWVCVLSLAALSTALAYILYFRILATAGAANVLLVTFLVPVSAILLGATILGERLHAVHFVGMALIGLGLACIDGRLWARISAGPRISA